MKFILVNGDAPRSQSSLLGVGSPLRSFLREIATSLFFRIMTARFAERTALWIR
jgi:hypothetical protein